MKIGILTLRLHNNYGGNLQAYALMTFLKKHNYEPILIKKGLHKDTSFKGRIKRFVNKIRGVEKNNNEISKHSEYFINRYIAPQTFTIESSNDFDNLIKYDFDAVVVGSDQVWRADYISKYYLNRFFLDFVSKSAKKISYAASFGFDQWDYSHDQTSLITNLLKDFDLITVREDSAVPLLKKNTGFNGCHVLDPTMLLEKKDYTDLINSEQINNPDGNCMVYILDIDDKKQNLVNEVNKKLSLKPYVINQKSNSKTSTLTDKTFPPVTDWLNGFAKAEFVITDSFHGTVFSILFNKPFLVIGNKGRGLTRFESLGNLFGISDRIITDFENFDYSIVHKDLDWNKINEKLELERKKSAELLLSNLSK